MGNSARQLSREEIDEIIECPYETGFTYAYTRAYRRHGSSSYQIPKLWSAFSKRRVARKIWAFWICFFVLFVMYIGYRRLLFHPNPTEDFPNEPSSYDAVPVVNGESPFEVHDSLNVTGSKGHRIVLIWSIRFYQFSMATITEGKFYTSKDYVILKHSLGFTN